MSEAPQAQHGVIDLSAWDFEKDGVASLGGRWDFYWNRLLTPADFTPADPPLMTGALSVPGLWNDGVIDGAALPRDGFATCRLKMIVDPGAPPLVLQIRSVASAYRLWLDDELVAQNGVVGTDWRSETPDFNTRTVDVKPGRSSFHLTLQISNYHTVGGGMTSPLMLGTRERITRTWVREGLSAVILAGLLLFMGGYHIALHVFWRRDRSTLYFAIYCLLWLANSIASYAHSWLITFLGPQTPAWLILRIDMISYFWALPVGALFFRALFPDETPRLIPRLAIGMATVYTLYLLPPPAAGLRQIVSGIPKTYHLWVVVSIGWIAWCLIRAKRRRRDGSGLILLGFLLMALVGANDILHDLHLIRTGYFMPFGMLLFIICQSFALARRFSRAFVTSSDLARELSEKNRLLERTDRLKDEFLANTSHELRTPLSGIIGITESLLAGGFGKLPREVLHNLRLVAGSGRRLTALINDILDFSRLRQGDVALCCKSVDVRAVAEVVITLLSPMAGSKGLSLTNAVPRNLWVEADEDRLQQIFYNLLGNAIKFSDRGEITIGGGLLGREAELRVTDQGIGIPDGIKETIFAPFEQAEAGADRSRQGVGLGLAITRNLVRLHGGRMEVDSRGGEGSVFRFTLPKTARPPVPGSGAPALIDPEPLLPDPGIVAPPEGPRAMLPGPTENPWPLPEFWWWMTSPSTFRWWSTTSIRPAFRWRLPKTAPGPLP